MEVHPIKKSLDPVENWEKQPKIIKLVDEKSLNHKKRQKRKIKKLMSNQK